MGTAEKRNDVLDIVKGIAAVLVVWGHAIQYFSTGGFDFWESSIFRIIYSFHMPLFMLVSGYVFYWTCSRKDLTTVIIGRVRGIGIPMLVWGTIIGFIRSQMHFSIGRWVNEVIGIWFLYAVLLASIIVVIINKIAGGGIHSSIHYAAMLLAGFAVLLVPGHTNVLFVYPYFVAGYVLNERKLIKESKTQLFYVLGWLILIPFYGKEDFIYTSGLFPPSFQFADITRSLLIDVYRWVIGFFGSMSVIIIVQKISATRADGLAWQFLKRIGRYTLELYVMQRLILEFVLAKGFQKMVSLLGRNYIAKNMLIYYAVTLAFSVVLASLLTYIAERVEQIKPLGRILFGKE